MLLALQARSTHNLGLHFWASLTLAANAAGDAAGSKHAKKALHPVSANGSAC